MQFYVKKWDVGTIDIEGDGSVTIGYQENTARRWWELPPEVQEHRENCSKTTINQAERAICRSGLLRLLRLKPTLTTLRRRLKFWQNLQSILT